MSAMLVYVRHVDFVVVVVVVVVVVEGERKA